MRLVKCRYGLPTWKVGAVAQVDKLTLSGLTELRNTALEASPVAKRLGFSAWLWQAGYERLQRESHNAGDKENRVKRDAEKS